MIIGTARDVVVDGCRIQYRRTGSGGGVPLFLVHGGGAHIGWWAEVVPRLTDRFDLIVPDLSGHGDSGHREDYSPQTWASELVAIAEQEDCGAVRYVGHSMGALVGLCLATEAPRLVEMLVLIDPRLAWPDPEGGMKPRGRGWRPTPVYSTEEEALQRFRLRPDGTTADAELLRRVGRYGLRERPDGWEWKFDPLASWRFTDQMIHDLLPYVRAPVGIVYGGWSPVSNAETGAYVQARSGRDVPLIEVPEAYHHVPLDQPETCALAIATMVDTLDSAVGADTGR